MTTKQVTKAKAKKGIADGEFTVKREFKYFGKLYKKGDKWIPLGGRYDAVMIEQEELITPIVTDEEKMSARERKAYLSKKRLEGKKAYPKKAGARARKAAAEGV
jgi:hypothetical protein